jgi:hypothetical protein
LNGLEQDDFSENKAFYFEIDCVKSKKTGARSDSWITTSKWNSYLLQDMGEDIHLASIPILNQNFVKEETVL